MCKIANRMLGLLCLSTSLVLAAAGAALAQTTSFTYQGRLTDGGTPANGMYEIQFTLLGCNGRGHTAATTCPGCGHASQCASERQAPLLQPLDFGATVFPGADRYLRLVFDVMPLILLRRSRRVSRSLQLRMRFAA